MPTVTDTLPAASDSASFNTADAAATGGSTVAPSATMNLPGADDTLVTTDAGAAGTGATYTAPAGGTNLAGAFKNADGNMETAEGHVMTMGEYIDLQLAEEGKVSSSEAQIGSSDAAGYTGAAGEGQAVGYGTAPTSGSNIPGYKGGALQTGSASFQTTGSGYETSGVKTSGLTQDGASFATSGTQGGYTASGGDTKVATGGAPSSGSNIPGYKGTSATADVSAPEASGGLSTGQKLGLGGVAAGAGGGAAYALSSSQKDTTASSTEYGVSSTRHESSTHTRFESSGARFESSGIEGSSTRYEGSGYEGALPSTTMNIPEGGTYGEGATAGVAQSSSTPVVPISSYTLPSTTPDAEGAHGEGASADAYLPSAALDAPTGAGTTELGTGTAGALPSATLTAPDTGTGAVSTTQGTGFGLGATSATGALRFRNCRTRLRTGHTPLRAGRITLLSRQPIFRHAVQGRACLPPRTASPAASSRSSAARASQTPPTRRSTSQSVSPASSRSLAASRVARRRT